MKKYLFKDGLGLFALLKPSAQTIKNLSRVVAAGVMATLLCGSEKVLAQNGTWTNIASMPQGVIECAGVACGGKFYVIGGATGPSICTQVYDPNTANWSFTSTNPVLSAAVAAGVINNKIYVAEGWINSDANNSTAALEIYDPTSNSWSAGASSLVARGQSAKAVIGGKLYITGGNASFGNGNIATLEIYDPAANTWSTGSPIPIASQNAVGAAINGKFYVVGGGFTNGIPASTNVFIYDPAIDTWTLGTPLPIGRNGAAGDVINGKLYITGGNNPDGTNNPVAVYDPVANSWSTAAAEPTPCFIGAAAAIGGQLYVAGGYPNSTGAGTPTAKVFTPSSAPGSLQVTITPAGAVNAGAQWQVDGGTTQDNEMTVTNLSAGNHTVSFTVIPGWDTPGNQTLSITNGQTTTAIGVYTPSNIPGDGLSLLTNGYGAIQHGAWPQNMVTGKKYTVTAAPKPQNIFSNWVATGSQSFVSNKASLSFTMSPGLVLEANFVTNPFIPVAGIYEGLLMNATNVSLASSGSFKATITSKGAFSANLVLAGKNHSFSGQFSPAGSASNVVTITKSDVLTVLLQLDLASSNILTGTSSNSAWLANISAYRSKLYSVEEVQQYTVAIPGNADSTTQPGGAGFGSIKVNTAGSATLSGFLADDTALAETATVSQGGLWPFYVSLYSGKGMIIGWLSLTNGTATDVSGELTWIKEQQNGAKYYAAGFTNQPQAIGSTYSNDVLSIFGGTNDPETNVFILTGGNLTNGFSDQVEIFGSYVASTDLTLNLSFSPTTGRFQGTVPNPVTGGLPKTLAFKGVVLQNLQSAVGFYLGANQTGGAGIASNSANVISIISGSGTLEVTVDPPTFSQQGSNVIMTITGTTSDFELVTNVSYELNNGDWMNATTTNNWATWSATMQVLTNTSSATTNLLREIQVLTSIPTVTTNLLPGTNTIKARAAALKGQTSVISSVSFNGTKPALILNALPNAHVGQLYSQPVGMGSGGFPPYYFTLETGNGFPPIGIVMDLNGRLSGTPSIAGSYSFGVTLVDLAGSETSQLATLIVDNGYTLTLATTGSGSGTISADPAGPVYTNGELVTLTEAPNSGSTFDGWSGDASGTAASVNITMDADESVTATFNSAGSGGSTFSLTLGTAGTGSGTVKASPSGPNYASGTVVTLTATAATGSTFAGWSGDASGSTLSVQVTINGNQSVTATFNSSGSGGSTKYDGTYSGPFTESDPGGTSTGTGTFTVTDGNFVYPDDPGAFTGTVAANGSFTGNWYYGGSASLPIPMTGVFSTTAPFVLSGNIDGTVSGSFTLRK